VADRNLIQNPLLIQRLIKLLGIRGQRSVLPTLDENVQAVVIMGDVSQSDYLPAGLNVGSIRRFAAASWASVIANQDQFAAMYNQATDGRVYRLVRAVLSTPDAVQRIRWGGLRTVFGGDLLESFYTNTVNPAGTLYPTLLYAKNWKVGQAAQPNNIITSVYGEGYIGPNQNLVIDEPGTLLMPGEGFAIENFGTAPANTLAIASVWDEINPAQAG